MGWSINFKQVYCYIYIQLYETLEVGRETLCCSFSGFETKTSYERVKNTSCSIDDIQRPQHACATMPCPSVCGALRILFIRETNCEMVIKFKKVSSFMAGTYYADCMIGWYGTKVVCFSHGQRKRERVCVCVMKLIVVDFYISYAQDAGTHTIGQSICSSNFEETRGKKPRELMSQNYFLE